MLSFIVSVFAFQCFFGYNPLLSKITDINSGNELSVFNRFAQCALIQAFHCRGIAERDQSGKGRYNVSPVLINLFCINIDIFIPNDTVSSYIRLCLFKQSRSFLQFQINRILIKQWLHIIFFI